MPRRKTSDLQDALKRIKEEIERLSLQQSNAIRSATYLGMTDDESRKYDQRRHKITSLMRRMMRLYDHQQRVAGSADSTVP